MSFGVGQRGNGGTGEPPQPPSPQPWEVGRQPAVLVFLTLTLAYTLVGGMVQLANLPFGLVFGEIALFAIPVLLLSRAANLEPRAMLRLQRPRAASLALAALVGVANYPAAGGLNSLVARLSPGMAERLDQKLIFEGATLNEIAMLTFAVGLVAPLAEELLFRGYLQRVFEARFGPVRAVAAAALCFGLMHLDPVRVWVFFELGCVFGVLVRVSGSVWCGVAAHVANNLCATALFLGFSKPGEADVPPILGPLAVGIPATAVALALFLRYARAPAPPFAALEAGEPVRFAFRRVARSVAQVAVAMVLALAVFAGTNWQAVRVVGVDFRHPVALDRRASAPALQKDLRRRLREVRRQAQRGARSVEDYEAVRAALAEAVGSLTPQDLDRLVPPARRP